MLRELYYRLLFLSHLNNENGLRWYGERCINTLLEKARNRSSSARKRNLKLKVEQTSTGEYLKSVYVERLLEDDEYFSIRKKIRMGTFFIIGLFVTECLLGYYSTLVLVNGDDFGVSMLRWLLAVGLTFSAISSSEKLLEALLPHRRFKSSESPPRSKPVILLWTLLFIGVQLAVIGVAETRVRDIEGGRTGSIIYYGFIALSMVLPLIAGTIAWEIFSFYDAYKQTRKYRKAQHLQKKLTHQVEKNIQREEDFYNGMLTTYWHRYNDFRSYKENYDARRGTANDKRGQYYYDFEEFKRIASLRYGPVRRDMTHPVMTEKPRREVLSLPAAVSLAHVEASRGQGAAPKHSGQAEVHASFSRADDNGRGSSHGKSPVQAITHAKKNGSRRAGTARRKPAHKKSRK